MKENKMSSKKKNLIKNHQEVQKGKIDFLYVFVVNFIKQKEKNQEEIGYFQMKKKINLNL